MNLVQLKINNTSRVLGVVKDNKIINLTSNDNSIDTSYKLFEKVINQKLELEKFLNELIIGSDAFDFNYEEMLENPEKYIDTNIFGFLTNIRLDTMLNKFSMCFDQNQIVENSIIIL